MSVRKVIAVFLLACFGILLPTAASPLRVCLLEERILVAEAAADPDCCSDCDRETDERDPCCMDFDALPDSPVPQPSVALPSAIITDLPVAVIPPPVTLDYGQRNHTSSQPIRGPTSPAAYRAVLGTWRL